jgi:hypothetical protein
MKSIDNGTTWTKTIVKAHPIPGYQFDDLTDIGNDGSIDTVDHIDGSLNVLIDNAGVCHVWSGRMRILDDDSTDALYSYFPYTDGILYWNETMGATAPTIITGAIDIDGNTTLDFPSPGSGFPFGAYGNALSSYPHAGIDASGAIFMSYSSVVENTDDGNGRAVRNLYVMSSSDNGATWSWPYRVSPNDFEEQVYCSMARKVDACVHMLYQGDAAAGHGVGSTTQDFGPNQSSLNEYIYVCATPFEILNSVNELNAKGIESLKVYPNPATHLITVQIGTNHNCKANLRLLNVMGQEITSEQLLLVQGTNQVQVNLSGLSKGVYIFNVSTTSFSTTERIVIK